MIASMKPKNGRCAVIMPQGVLFHDCKEGQMRKELVKYDLIECVITLVGGIFFAAGVSASSTIPLVFKRYANTLLNIIERRLNQTAIKDKLFATIENAVLNTKKFSIL